MQAHIPVLPGGRPEDNGAVNLQHQHPTGAKQFRKWEIAQGVLLTSFSATILTVLCSVGFLLSVLYSFFIIKHNILKCGKFSTKGRGDISPNSGCPCSA